MVLDWLKLVHLCSGWCHPALLGTFAHTRQMEQWFCGGTEHWRAEHSHLRAETAAGHHAGIAVGPAGVRIAGSPKILVLDGYECYSDKRVRVWRELSSQGISLGRRHCSWGCRWKLELCPSPGQQPASLFD